MRISRCFPRPGAAFAARALALVLAVFLTACTAPAPTATPTAAVPAGSARAETPGHAPAVGAPVAQAPRTGRGFNPAAPDRSCRSDSDCAVKDVGNCCGYFPMCVNSNAQTDPAAVRAACEQSGMASICGFQDVQGCSCVQGRCENRAGSAPAVM